MKLHLITDECPLWYATEADLSNLPISMGDPYWGFCWAGGQALARHVLDHPELVRGKRILDFGAGCGIEAVAALMAGAESVLAADIDPMALVAVQANASLNGVCIQGTTRDLVGESLEGVDVVLAGDMFYDPAFSQAVMSWLTWLALQGVTVLLGDPSRGNLSGDCLEVAGVYLAPADIDLYGKYLRETKVYRVKACNEREG